MNQRIRRATARDERKLERREIRWSGRAALLESEDTQFETTGRFRMWAQRTPNDEQVVLNSGRSRDIPAFVEWKLADDLLEIARRNPEDAQALAGLDKLRSASTAWESLNNPHTVEARQTPPRRPVSRTTLAH